MEAELLSNRRDCFVARDLTPPGPGSLLRPFASLSLSSGSHLHQHSSTRYHGAPQQLHSLKVHPQLGSQSQHRQSCSSPPFGCPYRRRAHHHQSRRQGLQQGQDVSLPSRPPRRAAQVSGRPLPASRARWLASPFSSSSSRPGAFPCLLGVSSPLTLEIRRPCSTSRARRSSLRHSSTSPARPCSASASSSTSTDRETTTRCLRLQLHLLLPLSFRLSSRGCSFPR